MEIQRIVEAAIIDLKDGEYINPQIHLKVQGENWGRLTLKSYPENFVATGMPKHLFDLQRKNKKLLRLVLRTEMRKDEWPLYSIARHLPEAHPTFYIAREHHLIKPLSCDRVQAKIKESFMLHIHLNFGFERMGSDDKVNGKLEIDEKEYKELRSLMDEAAKKNMHLKLSIQFKIVKKSGSELSVTM